MTTRNRRRPLVGHPFLLAAYPVLFLYGANRGELTAGEIVVPLALSLGATAACVGLLWAVTRDILRAALVTSILVAAFFGYGHVANLSGGGNALLAGWLAATVVLVWLALRVRGAAKAWNDVLNVAAAGLVCLALVSAAPALWRQLRADTAGPRTAAAATTDVQGARDIYYLVLDRYAAASTLQREFDFDNGRFLGFLRDQGFHVASDSRANYLKSLQSLASSLNMDYHHERLAERYGPDTDLQLPVRNRLTDHRVGRELQQRGYEYVHIGSWWDATQVAHTADVNLGYDDGSDFAEVLADTTVLPALRQALGTAPEDQNYRQRHVEAALHQFGALEAVRDREGPTFVFAHILLPHDPYVFAPDGSYVSEDQERSRSRAENFTGQLRYLNRRLVDVLTPLLRRPEDEQPVIILQADEGPHPVRYTAPGPYNWKDAPVEDLHEKFDILNAYYLPGVDPEGLDEDVTPVNTFRIVLNAYFDAGLELLPDRSFVFRGTNYFYDYEEVTERLADR